MQQDVSTILGNAIRLHQAGQLNAAIEAYRQALLVDPGHTGALANLGNALCELGKPGEAESCLRHAVTLAPGNAELHNNLGTALYDQGKLDDAMSSFRRTLALNPAHDEATGNLGTVLFAMGRLDEAVATFEAERQAKPTSLTALNSLGIVYWQLGRLGEAEACYRRILEIAPGNGDALDRLAGVLLGQGKSNEALDTVGHSLHLRETPQNRTLFCDIVRPLRWGADNAALRQLLTRALLAPWTRPERLAVTVASMVRRGEGTGAMIAKAVASWPTPLSARDLFGDSGLQALNDDHLLLALLTTAQNTDLALERFFTLARRALLEEQSDAQDDSGLAFRCALAQQCFINEYVFFQDDAETARAEKLRAELTAALDKGDAVSPALVATVASYAPLSGMARLLEMSWPAPLKALLTQQIAEPAEEKRIAAALPVLTPIEDAVSQKVRAMYEENPYPRWVKAPPPTLQDSIGGYLRRQFPRAVFSWEAKAGPIQFLTAGCGTGHLAVEFPQNIQAQVLAVDLSRASLAFAKRKADEIGLTAGSGASITFAQADILKLTGNFDAIECSGVLHHMADPLAAWRHLLTLLNPGGFMLVGFYSEIARQDVVKVRGFIAEQGYGSSAAEIRRARQDIIALPGVTRVSAAADFFGISTCRDLLFHIQEARYTLDQIAAFLKDNNLNLLGFEMDAETLAAYRHRFPQDPAATDLANWQQFESAYPDTFLGMYNFWVQKPL